MSLITKKINKEQIKVIPVKTAKPEEILGYNIFSKLFTNIFICAGKGSGKTNIVNKILETCINKETKVFVFASTHDLDDNWKYIKEQLEKRGISTIYYSAFIEKNVDNFNQMLIFMEQEQINKKLEEKEENINDLIQIVKVDYDIKKYTVKVKDPKKKAPAYIVIFDDMSVSLKKKDVPALLKTFRHYHAKVIISSQYFNDLPLDARMQIDYLLLFRGQTDKKLIDDIYPIFGCNLPEETFLELYKTVTKEQFQFLYIDKTDCEFRKNFNTQIEITK